VSGLTQALARERLAAEGPNAMPTEAARGAFAVVAGVLRQPMFLLLIGAAAVYLLLGDMREALVLAASLVVVIAITVVQERRTERTLAALRDLSSPRALVIRDGREVRIPGCEVVRGDLLLLREGDRVPADARLAEAHALAIDESMLTGESVPVEKHAGSGSDESVVFSGTLAVRGTGKAEVVATGARTELGRIGAALAGVDRGRTLLEAETAWLVRLVASAALVLSVLVAALYFALRGNALAAVLAGLTLAISLVPEEFPVVLTIFLALGAWRISRQGVLTRRLPAVEMLGATTVLCTDKTGTLTENRMALAQAWHDGAWHAPSTDRGAHGLLDAAALACEPRPFDPMERALLPVDHEARVAGAMLEQRYPLAPGFLAVCHGWRLADGSRIAAVKGAPETVLSLCRVEPAAHERLTAAATDAAGRGLRVLAVARSARPDAAWPADPREMSFEFLGFVALADPVRATVPGAIALCRTAGIRIVMITGDHPATALAIARQAGIDDARALSGIELDAMDDASLARAAASTSVYARVRPEQKLRIVRALRAAGEVVAMIGDGVNDAPALKAAHIGVAMGRRGTDVAREAASLVLIEDDFGSIVGTVRLGRRIHDNIRNAMRYLLAVHVPLAGMALVPLAAGWPLLLFPVHVLFMEFVIDPASSIVFEAEQADPRVMERPPREPGERLFNAQSLAIGFLLGAGVLVAMMGLYAWTLGFATEGEARATAFATLVAGNLALILASRSRNLTMLGTLRRSNPALWWIVAATLAALAATLYLPAVAALFRFEPIGPGLLAAAGAAGFASVLWYDAYKVARPRN